MSTLDDIEFDVEILRDVVYQIEHDMKALFAELARVKELVEETQKAATGVRVVAKRRQH